MRFMLVTSTLVLSATMFVRSFTLHTTRRNKYVPSLFSETTLKQQQQRMGWDTSSSSSSCSLLFSTAKKEGIESTLSGGNNSTTSSATASETTTEKIEWSTDRVRTTFIDFFKENGHTYQESSACAPLNDPTLLFTNAGMNQFKPIFLGQIDPNSPMAKLNRATNSQKCIRAGGKHNDLEDVGRDTYHHTFFEMLGSWSFGDYFKKEAIDYAWRLLTVSYQMDPERLYATYFEGDDQVEADLEARDLWLRYLPPNRVIASNAADNFWEMGDTGPCGPCTELHYDRIGNRDASALVNADFPDVIEIWNLVFVQYNRDENGLAPLPAQHVDTGMGLERLVSILQDKSSNYDTDAFSGIFDKIAEVSKVGTYEGRVGEDDVDLKDTAYRAIADHVRALSFAIADGAVPSNEGRGYVLRRILRRATRYGQQILKADPGFFVTLVPMVVDTFGETYPELVKNKQNIIEIIQEEEQSFSTMLDRGIKYFTDLEKELKASNKTEVSGDKAFFLYDTVGFPLDLTELMAEEAGMVVDSKGFKNAMEAQKQRSRDAQKAAKAGGADIIELIAEQTSMLSDRGILSTDDSQKYDLDVELPAEVLHIFSLQDDNEKVAETGDFVGLVLDNTSFYAEAGGQDADTGVIKILSTTEEGKSVSGTFEIADVQVYGGFVLHSGIVKEGKIQVGTNVKCLVDYERRRLIAPNHSMSHVLNAALRKFLGDGVDQRGSQVSDEKLRFDFSHKKAMSAKQLRKTEEFCQDAVKQSVTVTSEVLPLEEARELDGVRAVFGEVYPDPVRVISIGEETSVEFCGGTHIQNTAEAGDFVIIEETAVAKGVRRISAVTKSLAKRAREEGEEIRKQVEEAEKLDAKTPNLDKQAGSLRKTLDDAFVSACLKTDLRARIEGIQKKATTAKKAGMQQRVDKVVNVVKEDVRAALSSSERVLVLNVDIGADSKAAQKVTNAVKSIDSEQTLAFIGLTEEEPGSGGKLMAFAAVPESVVESTGLKADEWIRATLEVCGGRGGGKPTNAQGQSKKCADVDAVISAAKSFADAKITVEADN